MEQTIVPDAVKGEESTVVVPLALLLTIKGALLRLVLDYTV